MQATRRIRSSHYRTVHATGQEGGTAGDNGSCQLEVDIGAFTEKHNEDPKPFKWIKSADGILAPVKRFRLGVDQNLYWEL